MYGDNMVTTLYLIRHGQTEGGTKRYIGSMDIPLSKTGISQAERASDFIRQHLKNAAYLRSKSYLADIYSAREDKNDETAAARRSVPEIKKSGQEIASPRSGDRRESQLKAIYCSDLSRAVKTAHIIAEPHGLIPLKIRGLRERAFGIWEGMSFLEIRDKYPREFDLWAENPVEYGPVGGESTTAVNERVIPEFEKIVNKHGGQEIAIVAHGGINRIILCHVLGIPLENIFRMEQDCGAVTIIEFWDKYPILKLLNYAP